LKPLTRRELLKTGAAASAVALTLRPAAAANVSDTGGPPAVLSPAVQRQIDAGETANVSGRQSMDAGWKFHLGNSCDPEKDFGFGYGIKQEPFGKTGFFALPGDTNFDDSTWQSIDLPHDWAVELPFVDNPMLVRDGFKAIGREYPGGSIGWYRREFVVPASDKGRRLSLEFDGVYRDCTVLLNNCYLGSNLSGYAPFHFDITDFAKPGEKNVLLVRVDASLQEGWWYEGAGIYRNVWYIAKDPVHLGHHDTYIHSDVSGSRTTVTIETVVENQSGGPTPCSIHARLLDAEGQVVASGSSAAKPVGQGEKSVYRFDVTVKNPQRWSPESPYLYKAEVHLIANDKAVDREDVSFGIRTAVFDANRGLLLNGQPYKIKGTCNHQDFAGVGIALPARIQYYRIERLKEMGSNGCRTSHNPPNAEFLDACDRLGMLVMEETRMLSSSEQGISQLERMIKRDRNHPSVIIWSLGNEEMHVQGNQTGANIVRGMKSVAKRLDPSRPVTVAMNGGWKQPEGIAPVVDVMGCNYHLFDIDEYHRLHPDQPMIGTETSSQTGDRGIYFNDPIRGYVSAYDVNNGPKWAETAEEFWKFYDARPFLSGAFIWTGFDYRGEPTPYEWPCISSHFGAIDTCGFPKDNFYYYRAWWQSEPVLHLLPHWNWENGRQMSVWCYSNLDSVELFLNGKSLGEQRVPRNGHLEWSVKFLPGKLEAHGKKDGKSVLKSVRETSGAPMKLRLKADRTSLSATPSDVAMVTVEIIDARGIVVPTANNTVNFQVAGPGKLIGVGNGDPSCHESDKGTSRSAFNGLCMGIVQATHVAGEIVVTASAAGHGGSSIRLHSSPVQRPPSMP